MSTPGNEGAVDVAFYENRIEKLQLRLEHERKKNADLREQLVALEQAPTLVTPAPIDNRVLQEAKKAAHHDREHIKYLEQKLDLAERALRGLGFVFA